MMEDRNLVLIPFSEDIGKVKRQKNQSITEKDQIEQSISDNKRDNDLAQHAERQLSDSNLNVSNELVNIVMIRAESGEKFAFDKQNVMIVTNQSSEEQHQQQDQTLKRSFSTRRLLQNENLRNFLPFGMHLFLHSDSDQEQLYLGQYFPSDEDEKEMLNQQEHDLHQNNLITVTFKRPDEKNDQNFQVKKEISQEFQEKFNEVKEITTNRIEEKIKENVLPQQQMGHERQIEEGNKFTNHIEVEVFHDELSQNEGFQEEEDNQPEIQKNNQKNNISQLTQDQHILNEEDKRVNERSVKEALQLVRLWRDIHKAANERLPLGLHHISYEKVALTNKLCKKKTLDYFFLELRKAEIYGYDFTSNLNSKMGHVRMFNSQMAITYGELKERRREKELLFQLPDKDVLPVDEDIVNKLLQAAKRNPSSRIKNAQEKSNGQEIYQTQMRLGKHIRKSIKKKKKTEKISKKVRISSPILETDQSESYLEQQHRFSNEEEEEREGVNLMDNKDSQQILQEQSFEQQQQQEQQEQQEHNTNEMKSDFFHNCQYSPIARDPRSYGRNSTPAFSTNENFLSRTSYYQIQFDHGNFAESEELDQFPNHPSNNNNNNSSNGQQQQQHHFEDSHENQQSLNFFGQSHQFHNSFTNLHEASEMNYHQQLHHEKEELLNFSFPMNRQSEAMINGQDSHNNGMSGYVAENNEINHQQNQLKQQENQDIHLHNHGQDGLDHFNQMMIGGGYENHTSSNHFHNILNTDKESLENHSFSQSHLNILKNDN